jgi:hypothetical protein
LLWSMRLCLSLPMSAAPTASDRCSERPAPSTDKVTPAGRLLTLVRKLIGYGRELVVTFQQRDPVAIPRHFGTADLALILARITRGLHRAQALEERLVRNAARLDAPPRPRLAASLHKPTAARPAAYATDQDAPQIIDMPTPEQIAARVRRQPIGAVLVDICRDLGILPSHPLWPEIRDLISQHRGNLTSFLTEIIAQAGRRVAEAWVAAGLPPGPLPTPPAPVGPGPP